MMSLFVGLLFTLLWLSPFYMYIKDRSVIQRGLLLGLFTTLVVWVLPLGNSDFFDVLYYNNAFPFFEEFIKLLVIYFYPFAGDYGDREFYVMCASLGIGFSFMENILKLEGINLLIIVNIFVTAMHVITTVFISVIVYKSKYYDDKGWLLLFAFPVLIHYFYNMVVVDRLISFFNIIF